jgi:hypothetical protein
MDYEKDKYKNLFEDFLKNGQIIESNNNFKINLFLDKGENSLLIAKLHKDIEPTKDQPIKLHWNYWAITIILLLYALCYKSSNIIKRV